MWGRVEHSGSNSEKYFYGALLISTAFCYSATETKPGLPLNGGPRFCRAGDSRPSIKGKVVNILSFGGYVFSAQLLNSAFVAPK